MDGSAEFFGTRGLVKVRGTIDGQPFRSSFMSALRWGGRPLLVVEQRGGRQGRDAGVLCLRHVRAARRVGEPP